MGFLGFIKKKDEPAEELSFSKAPPPPVKENSQEPSPEPEVSDPFAPSEPDVPFEAETNISTPDPSLTEEELRLVSEQPEIPDENTQFIREEEMNEPLSPPSKPMPEAPAYDRPLAGVIANTELPFTPEEVNPSMEMEEPTPELPEADLTIPDLPDLPEETLEDSRASIQEPVEEMSWSEEPEEARKVEKRKVQQTIEAEDSPPALEEDAPYLAEPEEAVPTEKYVDSLIFYASLQEIKGMKKILRDFDGGLKTVTELDSQIEKETINTLGSIDKLQEELIKIDTLLFER